MSLKECEGFHLHFHFRLSLFSLLTSLYVPMVGTGTARCLGPVQSQWLGPVPVPVIGTGAPRYLHQNAAVLVIGLCDCSDLDISPPTVHEKAPYIRWRPTYPSFGSVGAVLRLSARSSPSFQGHVSKRLCCSC